MTLSGYAAGSCLNLVLSQLRFPFLGVSQAEQDEL